MPIRVHRTTSARRRIMALTVAGIGGMAAGFTLPPSASADGPGCLSAAGNGVCIGGSGPTVGGESFGPVSIGGPVGPVAVGGGSVTVPNPVPISVCYIVSCLEPGQPAATASVPSQTVPQQQLPEESVPQQTLPQTALPGVTPEEAPLATVATVNDCSCMSPPVVFSLVPGSSSSTTFEIWIDWGDGVGQPFYFPAGVSSVGTYHTYAAPGVYVIKMTTQAGITTAATVVCEGGECRL